MSRKYTNKGWPSVTEVIDLIQDDFRYWYGKYGTQHCEKVKKESQKIGHGVHDGIEKYIKGAGFGEAAEGLSDQQKLMLSRLVEWWEENEVTYDSSEESLSSKEHEFNGTYDCTGYIKKGLWIIDWKTDATPKDTADEKKRELKYALQTAGYALLLNENKGIDLHRSQIIRISKQHEFHTYTFDDLRPYERAFLELRKIHKLLKGR